MTLKLTKQLFQRTVKALLLYRSYALNGTVGWCGYKKMVRIGDHSMIVPHCAIVDGIRIGWGRNKVRGGRPSKLDQRTEEVCA